MSRRDTVQWPEPAGVTSVVIPCFRWFPDWLDALWFISHLNVDQHEITELGLERSNRDWWLNFIYCRFFRLTHQGSKVLILQLLCGFAKFSQQTHSCSHYQYVLPVRSHRCNLINVLFLCLVCGVTLSGSVLGAVSASVQFELYAVPVLSVIVTSVLCSLCQDLQVLTFQVWGYFIYSFGNQITVYDYPAAVDIVWRLQSDRRLRPDVSFYLTGSLSGWCEVLLIL